MQRLIDDEHWLKFTKVKSRNEFTDGFLISNCGNVTVSDLKTHLLMNQLDVGYAITTKTPGKKWVQLRDSHHDLEFILSSLKKALNSEVKQTLRLNTENDVV